MLTGSITITYRNSDWVIEMGRSLNILNESNIQRKKVVRKFDQFTLKNTKICNKLNRFIKY